jgi:hypothetical protein
MFPTFSTITFGTVKYVKICVTERKLDFFTARQTDMSLISEQFFNVGIEMKNRECEENNFIIYSCLFCTLKKPIIKFRNITFVQLKSVRRTVFPSSSENGFHLNNPHITRHLHRN